MVVDYAYLDHRVLIVPEAALHLVTNSSPVKAPAPLTDATRGARSRGLLHARSVRVALVLALLCAVGLLLLIDHSFTELQRVNTQRQTVQVVRSTLDGLMDNLSAAQANERGYLLAGEDQDADAFDDARSRIEDLLKQLDIRTAGIPLRASRLSAFKKVVSQEVEDMSHAVELRRVGKGEVATFSTTSAVSDKQTEELQTLGDQLRSEADALIAIQSVDFTRRILVSRLAFIACVLAVLIGFMLYVQQRYRLREADLQRHEMLRTERDRLEALVAERTRDLAELATHLQRAVERERAQLARALHDELGALMTAAKLDLARLQSRLPPGRDDLVGPLRQLKDTLNDAIALKRRITEQLYPTTLRNLGLTAALDILVRNFGQHAGLPVSARLETVALDGDAELTVYRLVQEALTNAAKHAHAQHLQVTLEQVGAEVRVSVADDGVGFDPQARHHGTHGLAGIRHRLWACGGQLRIQSAPGHGTELAARIPSGNASPSEV